MSKAVKELIRKEMVKRFDGVTSLAVVGFTGIDANTTREIRGKLREKQIRMTVVKNSIARHAFDAVGLKDAGDLLDGPCAIAFGTDSEKVSVVSVVRELLELAKSAPNLKVKAAFLEGDSFGASQIDALSKYPTRDEAIAKALTCVLTPGQKLAGCLIGPGGKLASILKTIQERAEKQEPAPADPTPAEPTPAEPAA